MLNWVKMIIWILTNQQLITSFIVTWDMAMVWNVIERYIYNNNNNIIYYTVIVQTITGVYALSHGLFYTCHENCAAPMSIPCCPRLSCSDGNHGSKSLISTLFCNYSYDMDNGAEKYDRIWCKTTNYQTDHHNQITFSLLVCSVQLMFSSYFTERTSFMNAAETPHTHPSTSLSTCVENTSSTSPTSLHHVSCCQSLLPWCSTCHLKPERK